MPISLGQTYGLKRKYNVWQAKPFYKPALHKLVIRHPGVNRKSPKVLERNFAVERVKPARKCKDLSWPQFVSCLSREMRKITITEADKTAAAKAAAAKLKVKAEELVPKAAE